VALQQLAIGGKHLAWMHLQHIAHTQLMQGHCFQMAGFVLTLHALR
jgi:hypothetical protein